LTDQRSILLRSTFSINLLRKPGGEDFFMVKLFPLELGTLPAFLLFCVIKRIAKSTNIT
jgi:hypothetical protein